MKNEEDDVRISRYLGDELTNDEKQAFEDRLSQDVELREGLQSRKQERTFLKAEASRAALEAKMAELAGTHFQTAAGTPEAVVKKLDGKAETSARVRSLGQRKWWAAGGIAAAVALALLIWNPFRGAEDDFRQFATYEPLYLTEKSSEVIPAAAAAEAAFNAGEYTVAFEELTKYLPQRPEDNEARLALGIAALETGRTERATSLFRKLAEGTTSFRSDGRYYLALAQIETGDLAAARATITALPTDDPDYAARRQKLLDWLDEKSGTN